MKLGKWIVGGLGWAFFGPIGALFGFAIGSILDVDAVVSVKKNYKTTRGDFTLSLIVLIAAVMKADGKVLKVELDYVKQFLITNLGQDAAKDALKMLKDLLNQDIPVYDVIQQIRQYLDYSSRLQLLHFLYGIAKADGQVHESEIKLIWEIGLGMGLSSQDVNSVVAMFTNNLESAYKILEINSDSTDDEVKKAYRKQAQLHHPDRVSYLGEEIQKSAKEKFQKISEAYEKIKKNRHGV
ncbi:MAG: molecular chaperone DjlA [Bacteroidetes bacterium CG02_land_8_20_14_3_00_31_25]|nr:DnaJ domain-containing protein [Bacteroidota bacterium]PIV57625.1 MAG: molecular chaperone DjlA [Bacteroidetes bacterium CG02_land_8_20_14_3_00_31_25]